MEEIWQFTIVEAIAASLFIAFCSLVHAISQHLAHRRSACHQIEMLYRPDLSAQEVALPALCYRGAIHHTTLKIPASTPTQIVIQYQGVSTPLTPPHAPQISEVSQTLPVSK